MCSHILKSGVSIGKLLVQAYLSEHDILIKKKSWSGIVRQHLSIQWLFICATCSPLQTASSSKLKGKARKAKKNFKRKDDERRGGLQWGIHLVKLGQGARNVWVKPTAFLGRSSYCWCCFLLCCQCVVWSHCQRLCSLYNSWINRGLFPGGLGRRWRRGLVGQRRRNVLQADKTETLKLALSWI